MPAVLCGLKCFDVPVATTASGVAREFAASLNPALNGAGCPVQVYRLEPVEPDVQLSADDLVACTIPGWRFDFTALEDLFCQFEDLRAEHDKLLIQYSSTKEILLSLNASLEAAEALEAPPAVVPVQRRGPGDSSTRGNRREVREVEQLKMQLTQSEKKQQETKASVLALRSEFMHLVDCISAAGGPKGPASFELPAVMKELDNTGWPQAIQSPQHTPSDAGRPGSGAGGADTAKPRHGSQPPTAPGARRPMGSPRVYRSPGTFTPAHERRGARPRGVHQRSGHSAGASMRQV